MVIILLLVCNLLLYFPAPPVRVGAEFQWYPVTPEIAGPKYSLMLSFVPVIPAPAWSKEPLLNF
jgi:hypothetical protein